MNKNKKVISVILSLTIVAAIPFSLGYSKPTDVYLLNAEEITRKIFTENSKNNTNNERIFNLSANYLNGLNGENDYILVECDVGGYAIFEKESMELIEYNDLENSPYKSIAHGVCYYAGPMNYFVENNSEIKNTVSNKVINKKEKDHIAQKVKEKIHNNREKRKEKQKRQDIKAIESDDKAYFSIDPGPTGVDIIDADDYQVTARGYADGYQFFIDNSFHGENIDGTCTSVAVQLLLAYNNWYNDGRIIPLSPSQILGGECFLEVDFLTNENEPYNKTRHKTTSSDNKGDSVISFYEVLKKFINPYARSADEIEQNMLENPLNSGATMYDAKNGIEAYLGRYASQTYTSINMTIQNKETIGAEVFYDNIVWEIQNGYPLLGGIRVYSSDDEGNITFDEHSIIIYGYQTIKFSGQSLGGFIAHFGWKDSMRNFTHCWFNADWVDDYLMLETSHQHMDDYVDDENHILKCSICNRTTTTYLHNYHVHEQRSVTVETENGADTILDGVFHDSYCACGYIGKTNHSFMYLQSDTYFHRKQCRDCSYAIQEAHIWKAAGYCIPCGQINPAILNKTSIEEIE